MIDSSVENYCRVPKNLNSAFDWKVVHSADGAASKETLLVFPTQSCEIRGEMIP